MRLATAAKYFDKLLCQDAFAPTTTFYGQFDVYDDSKRDGATVVRRVLSVAPDVVIPPRRVITAAGETWIVGASNPDSYGGANLRQKYVIQRAHGVATLRTVAQALGTGGTPTYASKLWIKDLKEIEVSSKLHGWFNVYLSSYDTVNAGDLIEVLGRQHLVRACYLSAAGFKVAEASELGLDAVTVGTYKAMTFSAVNDERTVASTTALNLLKVRFQDLFVYEEQAQPKFQEGDLKALVRKADVTTAKVNDLVTVGGEDWEILTVASEGDAWGLHLRHAGA
jgi:hypothetical protein